MADSCASVGVLIPEAAATAVAVCCMMTCTATFCCISLAAEESFGLACTAATGSVVDKETLLGMPRLLLTAVSESVTADSITGEALPTAGIGILDSTSVTTKVVKGVTTAAPGAVFNTPTKGVLVEASIPPEACTMCSPSPGKEYEPFVPTTVLGSSASKMRSSFKSSVTVAPIK